MNYKELVNKALKRIRQAIDNNEYIDIETLLEIQDILQNGEISKEQYDRYIKPYVGKLGGHYEY